jgi:hypothetical protein
MDWEVVQAIFIIIFIKIPGWFLKHPKALIPIGALIVGIFAFRSCYHPATSNPGETTKPTISIQQQKAPSVELAPYVLQTYSRVYYLSKFEQASEDKVILHEWYEWAKNNWIIQKSDVGVTFEKSVTGDFKLTKR